MHQADKNLILDKRIVFLDYLRIFAFATVLVGHKFYEYLVVFSNDVGVHATLRLIIKLLLPLTEGGGAGVVVFFLVSGYIITHVLQTEKIGEFLIKRFFRIYPLYVFAVLIQYLVTNKAVDFPILLAQLSLMGDFFDAPYTLGGVEWTLRVEVVFYVFMAFLNKVNFLHARKNLLPYIFIFSTILCGYIAPIPSIDIWSKGYLTIYGPFLLLGSVIYLLEKKYIGLLPMIILACVVFSNYFRLIAIYQVGWNSSHFAILAFFLFLLCWLSRSKFIISSATILLSDMTYAVYLFHNWFFEYAKHWLHLLKIEIFHPNVQALLLLFLTCFLAVKLIEKPSILFGRKLLNRIK